MPDLKAADFRVMLNVAVLGLLQQSLQFKLLACLCTGARTSMGWQVTD